MLLHRLVCCDARGGGAVFAPTANRAFLGSSAALILRRHLTMFQWVAQLRSDPRAAGHFARTLAALNTKEITRDSDSFYGVW